jgi:outer membrane protein TolC
MAVPMLAVGCRAPREIRDPEYADVMHAMARAASHPAPAIEAVPPIVDSLAGPQPVEAYVQFALAQNPQIHANRLRIEAAAHRVPQEASLDDPTLEVMGFPFYPNVPQTAAGRGTVRMTLAQEVPWVGTLGTRAQMAEAETEMARRELAAAELEVIEQVKRGYYELYYVQRAIRVTEEDKKLLGNLVEIAQVKYAAAEVTQQDVLRAQVELLNVDNELIRLRQELASSQARLARVLHISPETPLQALDQVPEEQVPDDLERLYQLAVAARPELHARLAAIDRDRWNVELARLKYFPNFAFSVDWAEMTTSRAMAPTADGLDDVGIGMMVNLPVYRQRLDHGVREAEAQTVATAREYDVLRDETVEQVKDLYAQATSQYELVRLFRDEIIPKADQTLQVSMIGYQTGKVDFLQLIDNWRQLLRFHVAHARLESQLRQTLAALERVVGGQLQAPITEPVPAPPTPTPPTPRDN